jgi:uroporphyrinogen decarboxylase
MKYQLPSPQPDCARFVRVIKGEAIPRRPPLVELFVDYTVLRDIGRSLFGLNWVEPVEGERESEKAYFRNWIETYFRLGYDYVRISGGLPFTGKNRPVADTAALSRGTRYWTEEGTGPIASWRDFEAYPWPDVDRADLWHYEFIAEHLPAGMGVFLCPASGFLEIPLDTLLGYENLCYLLHDDPELVAAVFRKTGETMCAFYRRLLKLGLPGVCGFFQGDDMGFKTGTLIGPDDLRRHVLPWHKQLADLAHAHGLLYLLHACGNLEPIMEDLIEKVGIDARHSFEDEGNSVVDFKRKYGKRIAVLGGIDVDKLSRLPEEALRRHIRRTLEICMEGGRYALGSGNSVANYVPVNNYLAMLEEGVRFGRP